MNVKTLIIVFLIVFIIGVIFLISVVKQDEINDFIESFWEKDGNGIEYDGRAKADTMQSQEFCFSNGNCYNDTYIYDMTPNGNNTYTNSFTTIKYTFG